VTQLLAPSINLTGSANLTAQLGSFQDSISTLLLYDLNRLKNMSIMEILSCHYCFAKPAAEVMLYALPEVLEQLSVGIDAEMKGYTDKPIRLQLDSATYAGATSTLKSAVSWIKMSMVETVNQLLSHIVNTAETNCGGEGGERHQGWTKALPVVLVLLPIYILSHIAFLAFDTGSLSGSSADQESLVDLDDGNSVSEADTFDVLREQNASLMTQETVPNSTRHIFPVFVIITIALLLVSNLSVGATVDFLVSTKDVQGVIRLPSLFSFSLGNTIREMYQAGIYVLLSIVVIFSGIWPYVKLLMMLLAWIAPESMFSAKNRGKLLFSLDALSKFSLVDTLVMVIMMVSFRFHLALGESAMVDVFVNPRFGFYGFLIATIFSLVAGHIELHMHRRCAQTDNISDPRVSLFSHRYSFDGRKYLFTTIFKCLLAGLMVITLGLLAVGSFKKSFKFEFGGLAGAVLGEDNQKSYSLISIGTSIPISVQDSDGPGIMFLQLVYFFYASIMPFVCLLSLSILMVVPMKRSQQELLLTAAEVANAWSAIEVFLLSIVAALFEMSTFASFIVGHKCDLVNEILAEKFDDQLHGDDVCYSIKTSVSSDGWFLIIGVILNSTIVSTLLRMSRGMLDELSQSSDDESTSVHWIMRAALRVHMLEPLADDPLAVPLLDEPQDEIQVELDGCNL
jgi:Paraquat-inducible protein A